MKKLQMIPVHDRACAALGFKSYRCRSPYGWIMIGATDDDDALREARRSHAGAKRTSLQRYVDGKGYQPIMAEGSPDKPFSSYYLELSTNKSSSSVK